MSDLRDRIDLGTKVHFKQDNRAFHFVGIVVVEYIAIGLAI